MMQTLKILLKTNLVNINLQTLTAKNRWWECWLSWDLRAAIYRNLSGLIFPNYCFQLPDVTGGEKKKKKAGWKDNGSLRSLMCLPWIWWYQNIASQNLTACISCVPGEQLGRTPGTSVRAREQRSPRLQEHSLAAKHCLRHFNTWCTLAAWRTTATATLEMLS